MEWKLIKSPTRVVRTAAIAESAAPDDDGGDAAVNAPARSVQPPLCLVGRAAERDRLSRVLESAPEG